MNRFADLSTRALRWPVVALLGLAVSGCMQVDGVHVVNRRGETDGGGYVMSMATLVYLSMMQEQPQLLNDLRKFSRPTVEQQGDTTYIADRSGQAGMEKFYDSVDCRWATLGWSDCTYRMRQTGWNFPAWSMDWKVVLPKGWAVIDSNHDRRTVTSSEQQLVWHFDGNQVNSFDITFTVRVPSS